ncbi:hypothetical protein DFH06DRAFT_1123100 [Mycena polygramma]|nr:hypothetical protein DFH06DRAFT_1123100 [Mycena polygramma]
MATVYSPDPFPLLSQLSLAHINEFSRETWEIIIEAAAFFYEPGTSGFVRGVYSLLRVCRRWETFVESQPELWIDLRVDRYATASYVHRHVRNSRNFPLRVYVFPVDPGLHPLARTGEAGSLLNRNLHQTDNPFVAAMGKALSATSHTNCWDTFEVTMTSARSMAQFCDVFKNAPGYGITRMSLTCLEPPSWSECQGMVGPFSGYMPCLTNLVLDGVPIAWWALGNFSVLERAALISVPLRFSPSFLDLTSALSVSGRLQHLQIASTLVTDIPQDHEPIPFPTVTRLALLIDSTDASTSVLDILGYWCFPALSELVLTCESTSLLSLIGVADVFRAARSLNFSGPWTYNVGVRKLFGSMRHLTFIDLRRCDADLLSAVCRTRTCDGPLPCPSLVSLAISSSVTWASLVGTVRSRIAEGGPLRIVSWEHPDFEPGYVLPAEFAASHGYLVGHLDTFAMTTPSKSSEEWFEHFYSNSALQPVDFPLLVPVEIWTEILCMACFMSQPGTRAFSDTLFDVYLVCKLWAGIVESQPDLWTHIIVNCFSPIACINRFVKNVAGRPFHISVLHSNTHYHLPSMRGRVPFSSRKPLQLVLLKNTVLLRGLRAVPDPKTWGSFELSACDPTTVSDICNALHDSDGSLITRMVLRSSFSQPYGFEFENLAGPFNGMMTSLTHLTLWAVPIPWDSWGYFVSLEHVSLRSMSEDLTPTFAQLSAALSRSGNLESLELIDFYINDVPEDNGRIEFPKVTRLSFVFDRENSSLSVLDALQFWSFPALTDVGVLCETAALLILLAVADVFRTCLNLTFFGPWTYNPRVRRIFASMPLITCLDMRGSTTDLLRAVCRTTHGDSFLPCPDLVRLSVSSGVTWDSLVFMVKARIADGGRIATVLWEHEHFGPQYIVPNQHLDAYNYLESHLVTLVLQLPSVIPGCRSGLPPM